MMYKQALLFIGIALTATLHARPATATDHQPTYPQLRRAFADPDPAQWGEVPLWWWEGDAMRKDRVLWELDTLAAQGVKAVCPIQRSPARCDPQSFSPAWWDMFAFVHDACKQRGMRLWAYDQIGYGHYGWLEKAAARTQDAATARLEFTAFDAVAGKRLTHKIASGDVLGVRAYPVRNGHADDEHSIDLMRHVTAGTLQWQPDSGTWKVAICVAVPEVRFRFSSRATDTYLDMLYGEIERRCGSAAMGTSFAGVFQDEHPPTPRDAYTATFGETFRKQTGYDLSRAVTALHFDVGPRTPKYRSDFFDAYLAEDERCYWQRVFDWVTQRGLLTSHDNWGRNNLPNQSQGYIDYFRTQRWFTAPGNDDYGQHSVTERNYYDTKLAASIARLYGRPRVWLEAFHSSGWGRTTDQTLTWLSADYAFGANLYDEHGLYYSTRAATWEHAAPDPHWRQPYWRYYSHLSAWVARMSYIMSQGTHVVDAAVHYPVVSFLAGEPPAGAKPDYNYYMRVSRAIYDTVIDNDIIDDDSILRADISSHGLIVGGNTYRAIVFGPERTMRRSVVTKVLQFAQHGGCVVFHGQLPTDSVEFGRNDPQLAKLLDSLLGKPPGTTDNGTAESIRRHRFEGGGIAAWTSNLTDVATIVSANIDRDVTPSTESGLFINHRRIGPVDVYLVQNVADHDVEMNARFRVDGVPELWDPLTGTVSPVDAFERTGNATRVRQQLSGNVAHLVVFRPGAQRSGKTATHRLQPDALTRELPKSWSFSVIPTRDNRWGEFRWPPSNDKIGPEVRAFRYRLERSTGAVVPPWFTKGLDDSTWQLAKYSIGPYWLYLGNVPESFDARNVVNGEVSSYGPGQPVPADSQQLMWKTVAFSQTIGLGKPAPWGGHSGYPDGAVDQNFVDLPSGRKILFTRIRSPRQQRVGLRIALRNSTARLWVNGIEQPIEDAIGNLPLRQGVNNVVVELPDGGRGMLYVQSRPPTAQHSTDIHSAQRPRLEDAKWIHVSDSGAGYLRKSFRLQQRPTKAKIIVTGYTGYRLFVNGHQVEEDIGPWAKWTHPETVDVTPYLQQGQNTLAAWLQVHSGQNVHGDPAHQALALALQASLPDGHSVALVSDGQWRCSVREVADWTSVHFDDSQWSPATVLGPMGAAPWGNAPVANIGAASEPRRKLAVQLPSPYLTCFEQTPEIVYDVRPIRESWFGWYRFTAPPGLRGIRLPRDIDAQVWINGTPATITAGTARPTAVPRHLSTVAIRVAMQPGRYAGAVFPTPIALELGGGIISPGKWAEFGMPTYAGIGVYRQTIDLTPAEVKRRTSLDLGDVLVAAEVLVNGKHAGVRLARPYTFEISEWLHAGDNQVEVRVANTLAPHYRVTNASVNLGPTDSGLLGPVVLRQQLPEDEWSTWARQETNRLRQILRTPTPELTTAQRRWESTAAWLPIGATVRASDPAQAARSLDDGSVRIDRPVKTPGGPLVLDLQTRSERLTGIRLEASVPNATGIEQRSSGTTAATLDAGLTLTANGSNGATIDGRFVRIEIVDRTEYLHLAEVQVVSHGTNVARKGLATQSSTDLGAPATRAIDGNTNGNWASESVTHTRREPKPWWQVDLGRDVPIDRIVIWNRTDGELHTRLHGCRVTVHNAAGDTLWQRILDTPPDPDCVLQLGVQRVPLRRIIVADDGGVGDMGAPSDRSSDWTACDTGRYVQVWQAEQSFGFPGGTRLVLTLPRTGPLTKPGTTLRISITRNTNALVDIPPVIESILRQNTDDRSVADQRRLAGFYRGIAPRLAKYRRRFTTLLSQLPAVGTR